MESGDRFRVVCSICSTTAGYDSELAAKENGWDLGEGGDGFHACPRCRVGGWTTEGDAKHEDH